MVASTPLSRARLTAVLDGLCELGAQTVSYRPLGGEITFTVGASPAEGPAQFEQPVVVSGDVAGHLLAWGSSDSGLLGAAVEVCSRHFAELWVSAREEESLAAEVIHAYDELHVLYGLGDALAGKLSVVDAAHLILDRVSETVAADSGQMKLEDGSVPGLIRGGIEPSDETIEAEIRSGGTVLGSLQLARSAGREPFSSGDQKLLEAVATISGNALRNLHLYQALQESEQWLRATVENVADGLLTLDEEQLIASFNPAAERLFGYKAADVIGQPFGDLLSNQKRRGVPRALDGWSPADTEGGIHEAVGRRRDGVLFSIDISTSQTWVGSRRFLIVSVRDSTERKRAEQALEHQALHDFLTGLPNRTLLHDNLDRALNRAKTGGTGPALLMLDLDRFKEVNDTFGHHFGDVLLKQAALRLQKALRDTDVIARMGGDEFAVLLPNAYEEEATHIARRLLQSLEQPFDLEGYVVHVAASIGIAVSPDHGSDSDALLRRADVAMYLAKRAQSGYALYTFDQDQNSPSRLALVGELRKAIDTGELRLNYQPKVDLKSNKVDCVEALVRWEHPQYGLLLPARFMALAEQTGLIGPLSRWVVSAALQQVRAWEDEGLTIAVAVNMSMRNLQDPGLPDMILHLLDHWKVPAQRLIVEVTETSLMVDPVRTAGVVTKLRDAGIAVSVDDFGTGYSSLTYLKRLSLGELKIDKSFVSGMALDSGDAAIVRSTIGLGHDLGLLVVAEGVEDSATRDLLRSLGCDVAQGYFFSRPLPPDRLAAWMRDLAENEIEIETQEAAA